jgi:hypothetical protein
VIPYRGATPGRCPGANRWRGGPGVALRSDCRAARADGGGNARPKIECTCVPAMRECDVFGNGLLSGHKTPASCAGENAEIREAVFGSNLLHSVAGEFPQRRELNRTSASRVRAMARPAVLNFSNAVACCAAAGEWSFGLCATRSREPRQARKGATVPGTPWAPQTTRSSSHRQRPPPGTRRSQPTVSSFEYP